MNEWMKLQLDKGMNEWMNEWMHACMNARINEWMKYLMDLLHNLILVNIIILERARKSQKSLYFTI